MSKSAPFPFRGSSGAKATRKSRKRKTFRIPKIPDLPEINWGEEFRREAEELMKQLQNNESKA